MNHKTRTSIVALSEAVDLPPFSGERKDAEIEALRFCFQELARCLHEVGVLDLEKLQSELQNAEWVYASKPKTLAAVRWHTNTLAYVRSKIGPLGSSDESA